MRRPPAHLRSLLRDGFTLVEVLIALALLLVLMGLIYAALDIHTQYSRAGQAEVEQDLVARTVLELIAADVRSVAWRPASDEEEDPAATGGTTASGGSTSGGAAAGGSGSANQGSGGTSAESEEVRVVDPSVTYNSPAAGLIGDAQTLMLHVARPAPATSFRTPNQSAPSSELKSVRYFLSGAGGSAFGQELSPGLSRLSTDVSAAQYADEEGDASGLAGKTQVLAPEINAVQFRYSDGVNWLTTWDSVAQKGLPRAVEIQIQVSRRDDAERVRPYRLVVALPLAKPDPTLLY